MAERERVQGECSKTDRAESTHYDPNGVREGEPCEQYGILSEELLNAFESCEIEPKTLLGKKRKKILRLLSRPQIQGRSRRARKLCKNRHDSGPKRHRVQFLWCWCRARMSTFLAVQSIAEKKVLVFHVGSTFWELGKKRHEWLKARGGSSVMFTPRVANEYIPVQACKSIHGEYYIAEGTNSGTRQEWDERIQNKCGGPSSHRCVPVDDDGDHGVPGVDEEAGRQDHDELRQGSQLPDITLSQKSLVKRLHDNMGHPAPLQFYRALKLGHASPAVLKYVKEKFRCEVCQACQARPLPKPSRPSTVVRRLRPNMVVGVDVMLVPDVDPKNLKPVLNVVDWGSGYQFPEPLREKSAAEACRKFWKCLGAPFWSSRNHGD